MFEYSFREDEALLFKGTITSDGKKAELYLTNVFITVVKNAFDADESPKDYRYSVGEIKYYNGIPQIKPQGLHCDVYFLSSVLSFDFEDKKSAKLFLNQALTLLTGKTSAERNVAMISDVIGIIDKTFGIDTVGTLKQAISNAGNTAAAEKEKKKFPLKALSFIGKSVKSKELADETKDDFEEKYEKLKKLKELKDSGILTQEEFEKKKRELLGDDL